MEYSILCLSIIYQMEFVQEIIGWVKKYEIYNEHSVN